MNKTYIFAARDSAMTHYEIQATSPADAVRALVAKHGLQSYRIVNVIEGGSK